VIVVTSPEIEVVTVDAGRVMVVTTPGRVVIEASVVVVVSVAVVAI